MITNESDFLTALNNLDLFKKHFRKALDLQIMAREFPAHRDKLYTAVVTDPNKLMHLIKNIDDIDVITKSLLRTKNQYLSKLFDTLEANPRLFKHIFGSVHKLCVTAEKYPKYTNRLFNIVLTNPKLFKHIFDSTYSLGVIARKFPQYGRIFNQPTPDDAARAAAAYTSAREVEKNARLLAQAWRGREKNGPIHTLLPELQAEVAALTGDRTISDEMESLNVALHTLKVRT